MTIATYKQGAPTRPAITHDNGFLGRFPARAPTARDYAQYAAWTGVLEAGEAGQGVPFVPHNDIPDALAAYRHFLFGNGADRQFSYERFVAGDANGAKILRNAIADAQAGADEIFFNEFAGRDTATFSMTGSAIAVGADASVASHAALFPYPATENWQKAIGSHVIWISADVSVAVSDGLPVYTMNMTLHAEDRYNFNPGAQDIVTGIPDDANGVFEITGLAHQYMNYATLTRRVTWAGLPASASPGVERPDRGRDRQPSDNRRLRNRR